MDIFEAYTAKIRADSMAKGMRVKLIATDAHRLPPKVYKDLLNLESETAKNEKFLLNICVSYGGRREIVNSAKAIAEAAIKGEIKVEDIDENMFGQSMALDGPDPDVLIRTSEQRLSNFLLWQLAYSELVFLDKLWPEITEEDLVGVIDSYKRRQRRFGK